MNWYINLYTLMFEHVIYGMSKQPFFLAMQSNEGFYQDGQ